MAIRVAGKWRLHWPALAAAFWVGFGSVPTPLVPSWNPRCFRFAGAMLRSAGVILPRRETRRTRRKSSRGRNSASLHLNSRVKWDPIAIVTRLKAVTLKV
jgi:hypothetical protein